MRASSSAFRYALSLILITCLRSSIGMRLSLQSSLSLISFCSFSKRAALQEPSLTILQAELPDSPKLTEISNFRRSWSEIRFHVRFYLISSDSAKPILFEEISSSYSFSSTYRETTSLYRRLYLF